MEELLSLITYLFQMLLPKCLFDVLYVLLELI